MSLLGLSKQSRAVTESTNLESLYLDAIWSTIEVLGNDDVHEFSRVEVTLIESFPCPTLGDVAREATLKFWTLRGIRSAPQGTTVVVVHQACT
jgi:hypothetical protein